jgi:DMSO/TMAO reductase YedYZ molybdopterin-dependent catalytic subunit
MFDPSRFLAEHHRLSRRYFLGLGAGSAVALGFWPDALHGKDLTPECAKACANALAHLEYLTPQDKDKFGNVSRGDPRPYSLPDAKKREVGLTRETWRLEVIAEPKSKAVVENPLTKENSTAFDWEGLMQLAKTHAVSFPKIMTCNNLGAPLGMGFWEGVPLRELIWRTMPNGLIRRVYYHGYHNDDPKQMFRSSLPIGRVLEDPLGLPPVILCYKLNGQFLNGERGGPVRMVVPETYGFKSIKWLNRVILTDLAGPNDTYADQDNDVDSWMKTFAGILVAPKSIKANEIIPVTGYAQVGISGLSKVQTWIAPKAAQWPADDPYFTKAPWHDAEILGPPKTWGGNLPEDKPPVHLHGFDPQTRRPKEWPMLLSKAHWAAALPGLKSGEYVLRARTIDAKGIAQPMPRPFLKSGLNKIHDVPIVVE